MDSMNDTQFKATVISMLTTLSQNMVVMNEAIAQLDKRLSALEKEVSALRIEMRQRFTENDEMHKEILDIVGASIVALEKDLKKTKINFNRRLKFLEG